MGKIKILSDVLCNHIAAGEVVERPAAVVKELIENSLDASASRISINFRGGGQKLIEVIDNGEGMDREDALLCVERHSTSKISSLNDLKAIYSMGFRGEALASISSVSKMTIITRTESDIAGTEIYIEGGKIKYVKDAGCSKGCHIKVKDLFFNVPARKKFLKTDVTERNHIIDCFVRLALAFPHVHFILTRDSKTLFNYPSSGDMKERVFQIFGKEITDKLNYFDYHEGEYHLYGYMGNHEISRPSTKAIYLFVNKRPVRDAFLNRVIKDAGSNYFGDNNYPFLILFMDLNPALVDVNVHPTKREVRFRDIQKIRTLIKASIKQAVESIFREHQSEKTSYIIPSQSSNNRSDEHTEKVLFYKEREPSLHLHEHKETEERGFFSSMSVLCQVAQTYIVCKHFDEIVIIDFHAAHERILYNHLKEKGLPLASQILLKPITFTIFPDELDSIEESKTRLRDYGYDVDILDHRTCIIRSVPAMAKNVDHVAIVRDLLKILSNSNKESDVVESFFSTVACHRALRSGKNLSHGEIVWLLNEMDKQSSILTCPHGRPVWIKLTSSDFAKFFGRT